MADGMKDSGQEWIGVVPEAWAITKNKYVLNSVYSGGTPTATNSNYYCDDGYPFVNIADMSTVDYVYETSKNLTKDGLLDKNLKVLPSGTILYSMYATLGHVSELKIDAAISQAMLALFVDNKKMNKQFYKYNMMAASDYAILSAAGTTQMNLNAEKVVNYVLVMPPISEQKLIADFLDEKCAEIDKLSEDIQKQIEILEEYKKSVITRAVTKGLDSAVEMKDSGVEWIGNISKRAEVIRIKLFSYLKGRIGWQGLRADDFIDEGPYCVTGTDFIDGGINWETCYHVSEERYEMDRNIQIKNGDLLMTKDGTIGKLALVNELPGKACLNSHLLIIRPLKNKYINKYLYYVMKSELFSRYYNIVSSGSTMDSLSQEKTGNFAFPVYTLEVQKKIVEKLDKKCDKINASIKIKNKQLNKLVDYKKSIIYEYVTGKKRVV